MASFLAHSPELMFRFLAVCRERRRYRDVAGAAAAESGITNETFELEIEPQRASVTRLLHFLGLSSETARWAAVRPQHCTNPVHKTSSCRKRV